MNLESRSRLRWVRPVLYAWCRAKISRILSSFWVAYRYRKWPTTTAERLNLFILGMEVGMCVYLETRGPINVAWLVDLSMNQFWCRAIWAECEYGSSTNLLYTPKYLLTKPRSGECSNLIFTVIFKRCMAWLEQNIIPEILHRIFIRRMLCFTVLNHDLH